MRKEVGKMNKEKEKSSCYQHGDKRVSDCQKDSQDKLKRKLFSLFFLMKLKQSETSKFSTIPVSPIRRESVCSNEKVGKYA